MAFVAGHASRIYGQGVDLSSYFTEGTIEKLASLHDTTTLSNSWRRRIAGIKDGTLSLSGLFDGATDAVDEELQAVVGASSVWTYLPEGDADGNVSYSGTAYEGSYSVTSPVDGVVEVSADLEMDDSMSSGFVLHALGAETAASEGTSHDNTASSANGGAAVLHVTAFSGFTDVTVTVYDDTASDFSTKASLGAFSPATGVTAERITFTGTVNRYVRCEWAVTGSGSITFFVDYHRL